MNSLPLGVSPYSVNLPLHALKKMIRVVRDLQALSEQTSYIQQLDDLPPSAQLSISHFSVMMGYDFHLTEEQQVKLIEVNTNTGGLGFACQSLPNPTPLFTDKIAQKLLANFLNEYRLFHQDNTATPKLIAIIDEQPERQFLYAEMQQFQQLFEQAGIKTVIIDPSDLTSQAGQLYFENQHIDLIYNRHCDFYFDSPDMQIVNQAWQQQSVCITPNPRHYGLLADKRRIIDWSTHYAADLHNTMPNTSLLASHDKDTLWKTKKQWVFKPINSYASRGVYVGEKLTKTKFNSLDPDTTLVQQRIKPSITLSPEGEKFKTDFRLFVYRDQILAVTARLYQGQVTNLRTPNGGFSRIKII